MRHDPKTRRSIFWLLCFRSLQVKRLQALLGIGSLLVGAAVCSLLLNLYGGVERKMTESFRAFGANVIIAPRGGAAQSSALPSLMDKAWADKVATTAAMRTKNRQPEGAATILPVLYVVSHLDPAVPDPRLPGGENVMAVGAGLGGLVEMNPNWRLQGSSADYKTGDCIVGSHLAAEMRFHPGDQLQLSSLSPGGGASASHAARVTFRVAAIVSTGDSADDQVFVPLAALEQLAGLPGKISLIEMRVPGDAQQIEAAIHQLSSALPALAVRPVRQIVYSEGRVLSTIRRLMLALTALILLIIALCVAATMTAIVLERRKDVAVMKALGASDRMVMELFLCESAVLGLLGGVAGFFIGAFFARGVAARLFHVALAPSAWVFPVICISTALLAVIATLLPVRVVRRIQPAAALKGA
ncbi:MAG TPA: FtsX-like permease family protein [Terriglobia bacterium]|nr:FtsX-like permease family protein [Terriglobia bacterium]